MEMLLNRLRKNWKKLHPLMDRWPCNAFRLYDRDIPEYPFLIDLYDRWSVIYEKGIKNISDELKEKHQDDVRKALCELLGQHPTTMIFKERVVQTRQNRYQKQNEKDHFVVVQEGPAQFYVNLWDYLDTGLFLDHRILRQQVYRDANEKRVLNLFSYTGSFSVMAALGHANRVVSVDLSKTYQEWSQDNFRLNGIDLNRHQWVTGDTLTYLKNVERRGTQFDLIILDPPTYSNSKKTVVDFDIQRDHLLLLKQAMRCLTREGVLYFSTPFRRFSLNDELYSLFSIKDISSETIPPDFHDQKIHHCFRLSKR